MFICRRNIKQIIKNRTVVKVTAHTGKELYKIKIKSLTGNVVIADEPLEKGGKDSGFSPKELLASSQAACTCATVRMYADRKEWDLKEINVEITLERDEGSNRTVINRSLEFIGNLDQSQRNRLLAIANACPVHKILSNPIEINTILPV